MSFKHKIIIQKPKFLICVVLQIGIMFLGKIQGSSHTPKWGQNNPNANNAQIYDFMQVHFELLPRLDFICFGGQGPFKKSNET